MNTQETWKNYNEYYQVSNYGRVRSIDRYITQKDRFGNYFTYLKKGRILKQTKDKDGYMIVGLGSKERNKKVHRLVAELFIPNPNELLEIDHKNGNSTDNRVENLQWIDRKGNMNNPITKERIRNTKEMKPIVQLSLDGEIIAEFYCLHEMKRQLGFSRWAVKECCEGRFKTYKGFIWMYK